MTKETDDRLIKIEVLRKLIELRLARWKWMMDNELSIGKEEIELTCELKDYCFSPEC